MKEPYLIFEKEVALWADIFPVTAITVRMREATHTSPPAPEPEIVWRCCEFLPRSTNRKPEDCEMVQRAAKAEREKVLKELIEWLEPQNLMLLKQKTYRKLQSLRAQQQGGVSE